MTTQLTTRELKHLRHICRTNGVPLADVRAVLGEPNSKARAAAAIRTRLQRRGTCTVAESERRRAAAEVAATAYRAEAGRGRYRRQQAVVSQPLTLAQRKAAAIRAMLPIRPGGVYSGAVAWDIGPVDHPNDPTTAWTTTEDGEQYSRRCTWQKTDAIHHFRVRLGDLAAARRVAVPWAIDHKPIVAAKETRPGIFAVRVIESVGKQVRAATYFAADQGAGMWHLANTERGAVTAANRAARLAADERTGRVSAAIVRKWGWCMAGVRQWCERNGVRRDLAARFRTGTSSAAIVRLIRKHGGPHDMYERRILIAAGIDCQPTS